MKQHAAPLDKVLLQQAAARESSLHTWRRTSSQGSRMQAAMRGMWASTSAVKWTHMSASAMTMLFRTAGSSERPSSCREHSLSRFPYEIQLVGCRAPLVPTRATNLDK